ncbi:uncharacterized protein yc1106_09589 [Curvularia clavata]|uniref:Uncharacterized protein n=1 Tax=Curvularia clavata TaxID=95742 RepID=A0A9Q9DXT8_CURCL|nr:uncharacterized protein yc1106_09589 [Curvularia clavata]
MKLLLFLLPSIGSVFAMSIPKQEAQATPCVCEPTYCIQSWPDSCYCANAAKKACYDKCGGNVPVYDTCPPRDVTTRAPETESESEPKSQPEPEPEPKSTTPSPPPTCECEQIFCLQSWPESCHCQNNAKKACFDKCGGDEPTYQTCPPLTPPTAPVVARSEATTECKCTEINCTLMWPTGCYCRNYAKQLCYEECGGERPALDICHDPSTSSLTTRTMVEAASLAAREAAKHHNQICSGTSGSPFPPCPSGQKCIRDPFRPESCGPACGEAGICVEEKMCGGFMGRQCEKKGQICVDNPMDDCDPHMGGADCAGVFEWDENWLWSEDSVISL